MSEKQTKPADQRGGNDPAVRSWITFPVLDWFLYTPSLRKVIRQLKAEKDFRPEGLRRMQVRQKWTIVIGALVSLFLYLYAPHDEITYISYIVFIYTYISICYILFHREILPYSIGMTAVGIVTHSEFHTLKLRVGGWLVWYEFVAEKGRKIKGRTMNVDKEDMDPIRPVEGKNILIFYDADNPRHNSMFAPGRFDQACISMTRYAKREELCNWGGITEK